MWRWASRRDSGVNGQGVCQNSLSLCSSSMSGFAISSVSWFSLFCSGSALQVQKTFSHFSFIVELQIEIIKTQIWLVMEYSDIRFYVKLRDSLCVVNVSVPATIKTWFPFLISFFPSCFLSLCLLFLLGSLSEIFFLLVQDSSPHRLQSLKGLNPFWPTDFCPIQPLEAQRISEAFITTSVSPTII